MESGLTTLKFVTIALYAIVLAGLLVNVGKAIYVGSTTGNWRPTADATIGQVVYWDNQIYEGITTLKNTELMNSLPESFREQFKEFVVRQIVLYLALFAIAGFLLFKLGNWLAGSAAFEPSVDIAIILIILVVVFPLAELGYGWIVHDEVNAPYRGVAQLLKKDTWNVLLDGGVPIDVYGSSANVVPAANNNTVRQVITVGG